MRTYCVWPGLVPIANYFAEHPASLWPSAGFDLDILVGRQIRQMEGVAAGMQIAERFRVFDGLGQIGIADQRPVDRHA